MAQATDESSTNVTPLRRADPTNAERQRRHRAKKRRPTVTPKPARSVTPPVTPTVTVERHGSVTVTTATLIAALALATCSAAFSISGLTSIFAGAFWPVIGLGVAFELGKLSAVAWLGHRGAAPARAHRPRRRSDGAQLDRRLRFFAESLERFLLEADRHSRCHRLPIAGDAEMPHLFRNAPPVQ